MKKLMLVTMVCGTSIYADQPVNVLNKVLHHEGRLRDSIVCLFVDKPVCTIEPMTTHKSAGNKQVVLFVPGVQTITPEVQTAITAVTQKRKPYAIRFEAVNKPQPGIRVYVQFKEDLIAFNFMTFDAISGGQKGIALHFDHKQELNTIHQKTSSLLRQAKLDKPKVVVDCGHGGSDEGKVGHYGIKEKDVTLRLGKQVADVLKSRGYDVSLTRTDDCFVALDQRTTHANKIEADIFVSIHANGAQSEVANGIETFWCGRHLLDSKFRCHDVTSHQHFEHFFAQRDKASFDLASCIHEAVLGHVQQKFDVIDRRVKSSVGQVIFGSEMPSALIEIGFLSHKQEAKRLGNMSYLRLLAQGICAGIESYFKKLLYSGCSPMA